MTISLSLNFSFFMVGKRLYFLLECRGISSLMISILFRPVSFIFLIFSPRVKMCQKATGSFFLNIKAAVRGGCSLQLS